MKRKFVRFIRFRYSAATPRFCGRFGSPLDLLSLVAVSASGDIRITDWKSLAAADRADTVRTSVVRVRLCARKDPHEIK